LKLAEFIENNQVPKGQIRAGGIDAQLDAQGLTPMKAVFEFSLADDVFGVGADGINQAHGKFGNVFTNWAHARSRKG
jgi:hypothetical protein